MRYSIVGLLSFLVSQYTNTFHIPYGLITPTLFDIASVTDLKPTRGIYSPSTLKPKNPDIIPNQGHFSFNTFIKKPKPELTPISSEPAFYCTEEFQEWWKIFYLYVPHIEQYYQNMSSTFAQTGDSKKKTKGTHLREIQRFKKFFHVLYRPTKLREIIADQQMKSLNKIFYNERTNLALTPHCFKTKVFSKSFALNFLLFQMHLLHFHYLYPHQSGLINELLLKHIC